MFTRGSWPQKTKRSTKRPRTRFPFSLSTKYISHRHKGSLEDVVGKEVPAEVEEVVDDVDLALFGLSRAERLLGLAVARVHEDDEHEADDGGDQRGHEEEAHGPEGDHAVHLGVQTRRSCMKIAFYAPYQDYSYFSISLPSNHFHLRGHEKFVSLIPSSFSSSFHTRF